MNSDDQRNDQVEEPMYDDEANEAGDEDSDGASDRHGDGHHDNPDLAADDPEVNGNEDICLNQEIHRG